MKKGIWIVLIIIIAAVIVIVSGDNKTDAPASAEKAVVKIGVSLAMTGDLAFIGETDRNAMLILQDEIASSTNLSHTYEFIVEDNSFDATKAATAASKLINVDKVNAIVSVGSPAGNATSPVAEAAKVIHFGTASDANVAKGEYNFTHWTMPQEEVIKLVEELNRRGLTKIALLAGNHSGINPIVSDIEARIVSTPIKVVGKEIFTAGQKDFRTMITKLQKTNPEIYVLLSFDPETGLIAKQFKALGIKTPLTSIETFGLTADPSVFEGQWYIDAAEPTASFASAYMKRFGKQSGPAAANVYDELRMLVNAFETVSNPSDTAKVAAAVAATKDYSGALGTLTVDSEGIFRSEASVKVIKNGKPEVLKVE